MEGITFPFEIFWSLLKVGKLLWKCWLLRETSNILWPHCVIGGHQTYLRSSMDRRPQQQRDGLRWLPPRPQPPLLQRLQLSWSNSAGPIEEIPEKLWLKFFLLISTKSNFFKDKYWKVRLQNISEKKNVKERPQLSQNLHEIAL